MNETGSVVNPAGHELFNSLDDSKIVSQGVAVGAHCPVVIVRPEHALDDEEPAPLEPLAPPQSQ